MAVNEEMGTPRLDPETMQGLIDGSLSPDARKRALAVIAESPADREWFREAAATLQDLDGTAAATPARPPRRWLSLLAAAAAVLAVGIPIGRQLVPDDPIDDARAAAWDLGQANPRPFDQRFGAGWADTIGVRTRGDGPAVGTLAAVLVGISVVDLEAGAAAGDSVTVVMARDNLVRLLGGIPGGGPSARLIEDLPWPPPASARAEAVSGAVAVAGSAWTAVGAWLELARLAAADNPQRPLDPARIRRLARQIRRDEPAAAGWLDRLELLLATPAAPSGAAALLDSLLSSR